MSGEIKSTGNQEMVTWHNVGDCLPENFVDVLIKAQGAVVVAWYCEGEWEASDGAALQDVTHWAEIPAGPEVAS